MAFAVAVLMVLAAAPAAHGWYEYGGCELARWKWLQYLDRQEATCSSGAMRGFKLTYCGSPNMRMRAECRSVTTTGACTHHSTGCNVVKNKGLHYLDRHNVDCGAGKALRYWKMQSSGCSNSYQQIYYTCCPVSGFASTRTMEGACEVTESKTVEFLDRHEPRCNWDEVLSQFTIGGSSGCSGQNRRIEFTCLTNWSPMTSHSAIQSGVSTRCVQSGWEGRTTTCYTCLEDGGSLASCTPDRTYVLEHEGRYLGVSGSSLVTHASVTSCSKWKIAHATGTDVYVIYNSGCSGSDAFIAITSSGASASSVSTTVEASKVGTNSFKLESTSSSGRYLAVSDGSVSVSTSSYALFNLYSM